MAAELVIYETRYPAALITLNNPAHRNALSRPMIDALMEAIARAEQDSQVRALVFTGTDPAFSAGMDLKELREEFDRLRMDEAGAVWQGALRGDQAGKVILHLMRMVGERVARHLLLTGELISAARAKEIGLINEVVPRDKLLETALAWVDAIASNAPKAETMTKSLMRRFSAQAIAMNLTEYTAAPHVTDEARAGLEAFFSKRPPPWLPSRK